jgi:hypothetical protein
MMLADHVPMRDDISILFIVATVLVGCSSPSQVSTQTTQPLRIAAPTVAAPPAFHPMLVTSPGTHTSPDGRWRIGVSESALDLSRSFAHDDGRGTAVSGWSTISPQGWTAQPGWFVFIQSESNVWVYDGDDRLLLYTESSTGNQSTGTISSGAFSCPVPAEVLTRIPEPARKAMNLRE